MTRREFMEHLRGLRKKGWRLEKQGEALRLKRVTDRECSCPIIAVYLGNPQLRVPGIGGRRDIGPGAGDFYRAGRRIGLPNKLIYDIQRASDFVEGKEIVRTELYEALEGGR